VKDDELLASYVSQTYSGPENAASDISSFVRDWRAYSKNPRRSVNDAMASYAAGLAMWIKAVEKAKSVETDKVIDALPGIAAQNLTGNISVMLPDHPDYKVDLCRQGRSVRAIRACLDEGRRRTIANTFRRWEPLSGSREAATIHFDGSSSVAIVERRMFSDRTVQIKFGPWGDLSEAKFTDAASAAKEGKDN
jgi:hypothetical protein